MGGLTSNFCCILSVKLYSSDFGKCCRCNNYNIFRISFLNVFWKLKIFNYSIVVTVINLFNDLSYVLAFR